MALPARPPPRTPFHQHAKNSNIVPSSSPAFAPPNYPIRSANGLTFNTANKAALVLPILLPPATLRPIAFRTFTKKHNLTLTSTALQALATFIGKNCGAAWREAGLAELVLEEVARSWKKADGRVIVDDKGPKLNDILRTLEAQMSGGRIVGGGGRAGLSRQGSLIGLHRGESLMAPSEESQESLGMGALEVDAEDVEEEEGELNPRRWLKAVSALEQPRLVYNATRKHFEKSKSQASFFPSPAQKTELFRQRYHLMHQRLLRNEHFQTPSLSSQANQSWRITPIANLLGRSGSSHLLLGLLTVAPTGTLALNDLTGSISLDLGQATPIDRVDTWLCPGMIVLVDGVYEEEFGSAGGNLGNMGGIGGTIGGRFIGFSVGAPRCESRASTLGISDAAANGDAAGGLASVGTGFGWVDFLGVGSERALGVRMRRLETRMLREHAALSAGLSPTQEMEAVDKDKENSSTKVVVLGEVTLDNPATLVALRKILTTYSTTSASIPLVFILLGNFISTAAMAASSTSISSHITQPSKQSTVNADSIAYKEHFDDLAALLSDFPMLLRHCTWIFVPGDNDPWASAFSAGAATPLPREGIPDVFTGRIKRAFAAANAGVAGAAIEGDTMAAAHPTTKKGERTPGSAIWTTNPSRLTMFGPAHEMVLFRDDLTGRLRRNSIALKKETAAEDISSSNVIVNTDGDALMSGALPASPSAAPSPSPSHTATVPMPSTSLVAARRLTKTILDQSHLSPFPLNIRPVHWSFAHSLALHPLPTVLICCDADAEAFAVKYQGCWVLNPGVVVGGQGRGRVKWCEWDVKTRKGEVKEGCW